jgi:hypothetical protein
MSLVNSWVNISEGEEEKKRRSSIRGVPKVTALRNLRGIILRGSYTDYI